MGPLVSILIPAFNAEAFIADAIGSALRQTWLTKEIIVVDDGSTDRTMNVAREFDRTSVLVVSQENMGAAAARNKALKLARGEFVQWLDADDVLEANKIERQMRVLMSCGDTRTLASGPWAHFLYRTRKARFRPSPLWCDLSPVEWLATKMASGAHMQTATWLVSRELTEAAGPWDTRLLGDDDGEYFCRVLRSANSVKFVADAKTYYRITGGGSLSYVGVSSKKVDAQFVSCKLHVAYALSLEDTDRMRAACTQYLQRYLAHFYPERPDLVAQMQDLAAGLGGRLSSPKLPWKYAWIRFALGWNAAKRAQRYYNAVKWTAKRSFDRVLLSAETGTRGDARLEPG